MIDAISGFEDEGDADTCAEFLQEPGLAAQCGSWTLDQCSDEFKVWIGCIYTTTFTQGGLDCQVDCDAVPSGSDGALGLTTTLAATAVAVAAAF